MITKMIVDTPVIFWCRNCHRRYYIDPMADEICPECGWKEGDPYQDRWGFWHDEEEEPTEADRAMLSRLAGGRP